ncbi:MAG: 3-oxoacyl-ACP reductase [Streptosporangiales bacterium]|nr:3-oxoacyl-ACP reductase [Streptosporangiales bacterium]MBO0889535.1 3-oxoacyl-ACP reductase [Acidothermales bacterium]
MALAEKFIDSPVGRRVTKTFGLAEAAPLRRWHPDEPLLDGPVLVGHAEGGRMVPFVTDVMTAAGAEVTSVDDGENRYAALVFDATGVQDVRGLTTLFTFYHETIRRLRPSGRVLVLGRTPEQCTDPASAAAQRALDGFVRSVAKEARAGATANLAYLAPGAEDTAATTLRFFLSGRSAYVDGQVVRLTPAKVLEPRHAGRPLGSRVALVTGAARGLGAAIAANLARAGALPVCLDVPAQGERLTAAANEIDGVALQLDITAKDAPQRLARYLRERYGGVDVVVHNAGITRDKLLANMTPGLWQSVLDVNLDAQLRINAALLDTGVLRSFARVVCVSSQSGIAGNRGQTNYAASKAGIIGMVGALAPVLAERGSTANAVAPGFIETEMTAEMPTAMREMGRRINSLGQGGLPVDVAETVTWLAHPGSGGVNGQIVRVCGQSMLGA